MNGDDLRLNRIAEEFDAVWAANDMPSLENYLQRVAVGERLNLTKLLLPIDVEYRTRTGSKPKPTDYQSLGTDVFDLAVSILDENNVALDQSDHRFDLDPLSAEECPAIGTDPYKTSSKGDYPKSRTIGPYKLLQEIGEGGMGSVWMAQQEKPVRRRVALKLIKSGLDSKQVVARFEAERQALAMMDHQNIAKVLDAGTTVEGLPYFVMELVQGIPFNQYCDSNKLAIRDRLELFIPICGAVQHAHQKGVVHRDIKPANVLVTLYDGKPVPKIIDFGLAKALQHQTRLTDKTMFTEFGQVVGTLQYMSPEQAEMNALDIDTRTDIYSLGVMLYELLTGSTPIEKETVQKEAVLKVLETIREKEPPRPSHRLSSCGVAMTGISQQRKIEPKKLHQILRGDLDWIVMKAIEKDRRRRYETANGLGADVGRYLSNETITARPPTTAYRTQKFVQKNKGLVASLASIAILLVAGIAGTTWFAIAANRARDAAKESESRAIEDKMVARVAKSLAEESRNQAELSRRETEETLANTYTSNGIAAADAGNPGQAVLWFANAAQLARHDEEKEKQNRLRALSWARQLVSPIRVFPHDSRKLKQMEFNVTGRYLMTVDVDAHCVIWDLVQEKTVATPGGSRRVSCATWNPNGTQLVIGDNLGTASVFSFPDGKELHSATYEVPITAIAYSSDGNKLALASDTVHILKCPSFEPVNSNLVHPMPVIHLMFNSRGDRLLTGCDDGMARMFSVASDVVGPDPLFPPVPNYGSERFKTTFVDDDKGFLTLTADEGVVWRDATTGEQIRLVTLPGDGIQMAVVSPDAHYFAVGGFSGAQLWDVASGEPVSPLLPHGNFVHGVAFSPDGSMLLTGSGDRTARLWSIPLGKSLGPPIYQDLLEQVAFSPSGYHFATSQDDGFVRVWSLPITDPRDYDLPSTAARSYVTLDLTGAHLMPTGMHRNESLIRSTRVYDFSTGDAVGCTMTVRGRLRNAAFSPDAHSVVTVSSSPHEANIWDWRSGKIIVGPVILPSQPAGVAFSPDGVLIVVSCVDGAILMIRAADGELQRQMDHGGHALLHMFGPSSWIRFTQDGRSFVSWGLGENAQVWDAATGELQHTLRHHDFCFDASFSTEQLLVTSSMDKTVTVWNLATGQPAATPLRHPDWVFNSRFSPAADRKHVLTACRDGMARLFDWQTGEIICSLAHQDEVFDVGFSKDGDLLITASRDMTARVWEWHTGKPLIPSWTQAGWPIQLLVTPDGSATTLAGFMETIQIRHLPRLTEFDGWSLNLADLRTLGEIVSGQTILQKSGPVNLHSDEWLERWQEFRKSYPDYHVFDHSVEESVIFYRQQAATSEQNENWFATAWNLTRLIKAKPKDETLHARLGFAHRKLMQFEDSFIDYSKAIDLGNTDPHLWADRGDVLLRLTRWSEAVDDYTTALKGVSNHAHIWRDRGHAYFEIGKWDQAAEDYAKAIELGDRSPNTQFKLEDARKRASRDD